MRFKGVPVQTYQEPREERSEVRSAYDPDYDPTYGDDQGDRQHVEGQSFAGLRDEMNERRRATARRWNR